LRSLTVVLALLAALVLPAVATAAAKCPASARCGSVDVPVDRAGTVPGTFPIAYATLPATGPRVGTIVFLNGGPGQSTIVYTEALATILKPLRGAYDIVAVDQRGTGRSGTVECGEEMYDGDFTDLCGKHVGDKRAFLTTVETARDLDAVRVALGVEQIIPLGVSYGTKVAGEYARRFPQHTQAVVLDSPVGVGPIDFLGLDGIQAMPRVLSEMCAAGPCSETVADPGSVLERAVARVGRGLRTPAVMGREAVGRTTVSDSAVYDLLLRIDVNPVRRADLPAALASLARGDAEPLLHLREREREKARRMTLPPESDEDGEIYWSDSRFFATACLESQLPWATTSAPGTRLGAKTEFLAQLGPVPFAPFRPALVWKASDIEKCLSWPATAAPEPVPDAGPDVPVLVIAGRADVRTPLELATQVAATYPRATLLDVPQVGHSVLTTDASGCALRGLSAFLAQRAPERCAPKPPLPAGRYLPPSARGMTVATIARYTVEGVLHDLHASRLQFGKRPRYELWGLRGGWADVRRGRIKLHDVSWFRGFTVSGTITVKGKGRLTVEGPGSSRSIRL
jgi:pimeloyl-ACP methyl ester carboxylesterase